MRPAEMWQTYMNVEMPLEAKCFLMSLSVPYQLNPFVECPMRGRCTLALQEIEGKKII